MIITFSCSNGFTVVFSSLLLCTVFDTLCVCFLSTASSSTHIILPCIDRNTSKYRTEKIESIHLVSSVLVSAFKRIKSMRHMGRNIPFFRNPEKFAKVKYISRKNMEKHMIMTQKSRNNGKLGHKLQNNVLKCVAYVSEKRLFIINGDDRI